MKCLIAPDSFKDSLSADRVARALERGLLAGDPEIQCDRLPLADGGEGTLDAWLAATGALNQKATVQDPLGRPVEARWGWQPETRTALVEMAEASGLQRLVQSERNPTLTSSYGTGELIRVALEAGAKQILVALGGSATNDAGAGLLAALGVRWLDRHGHPIPPGGLALASVAQVDLSGLDSRCRETSFRVACDVTNPLLGPNGASHVFGPQKGATPDVVEQLEVALTQWHLVMMEAGIENPDAIEGGGAAGGCAAGLVGLLQADLVSGIDLMLDCTGFNQRLSGTDWVITGEGRIDEQTAYGKTIAGIARRCLAQGVPVIAVGGAVEGDLTALYQQGVTSAFAVVNRPCTLPEALAATESGLIRLGADLARLLRYRTVPVSRG